MHQKYFFGTSACGGFAWEHLNKTGVASGEGFLEAHKLKCFFRRENNLTALLNWRFFPHVNQCFGRPRTADIKCLTMHLSAWTWFQNMTYPPLETNSNFALEKTMGLEWMECPFGWDVLPIFRGYAAMQGVVLGNKKNWEPYNWRENARLPRSRLIQTPCLAEDIIPLQGSLLPQGVVLYRGPS